MMLRPGRAPSAWGWAQQQGRLAIGALRPLGGSRDPQHRVGAAIVRAHGARTRLWPQQGAACETGGQLVIRTMRASDAAHVAVCQAHDGVIKAPSATHCQPRDPFIIINALRFTIHRIGAAHTAIAQSPFNSDVHIYTRSHGVAPAPPHRPRKGSHLGLPACEPQRARDDAQDRQRGSRARCSGTRPPSPAAAPAEG